MSSCAEPGTKDPVKTRALRSAVVRRALFAVGAVGLGCCLGQASFAAGRAAPLRQVQTIALDGVEGRIDHMAIDAPNRRLFVAALGNGTVEVLDLRSGRRIQSMRGFHEPQGLGFVASPPRLFVSNGGGGTCDVFDGATLAHLRTLQLPDDADNIRCDTAARRVYVGCGEGALRALDATTGDSLGSILLPGHPESFQLERAGPRVFVNVPDASQVVIVDRVKGRVIGRIAIRGFSANFPMALDEDAHRLFVGCRRPSAVLVFDDRSERRLSTVPIDGDADDLFYDGATRQLFASCGAGFIDVLGMRRGRLTMAAKIATAPGARTALYVPALRRLYLAVPRRGGQRPEIRVFDAAPRPIAR
ncbi:MAG TPA: hypothetical protein VK123_06805 [Candidatus Limnocylindrales bacterium]|nr:hypothetical protein [Candidatus Limnocylindrales bacterium]